MDVDKSGRIDQTEVAALLQNLGEGGDADAVHSFLAEIDEDNDGQINFEEFLACMAAKTGKHVTQVYDKDKVLSASKRVSAAYDSSLVGQEIHAGWMEKRATSGPIKNWKRRYFVLKSDRLQYFLAPEGKLKGEIVFIHGSTAWEAPEVKEGAFKVSGQKEVIMFQPDDDLRSEWIGKISQTIKNWEKGINLTLALLLGDDPSQATAAMAASGDNYASFMQMKNGVSLSPLYIRMGKPVPVEFQWHWKDANHTPSQLRWKQRKLIGGTEWEIVPVKNNKAEVTMRPGLGYTFTWMIGEQEWLSPLQQMPSLLFRLKKVPLLGSVISSLPEEMQKKVNSLPDGKVKDMLMALADMMPQNPFDVSAGVRMEHGIFLKEEQVLTRGQKLLKLKDEKMGDPMVRFALRAGLLTGAILALGKGFELVGLGFIGVFLKESIDALFMPSPKNTREAISKLENKKEVDGSKAYETIEECWEGTRHFIEEEMNHEHQTFQGGIRVTMPKIDEALDSAISRMPVTAGDATVPVLFQWPHAAAEVKVLYCEMTAPLKKREEEETKALGEAKAKWQAEQVEILKKKFGFIKVDEGEEVPSLSAFKYEKPEREVLKKDWTAISLTAVEEADPPAGVKKEKVNYAKFAAEKPLPNGMYCYKFVADGKSYFKPSKAIPEDSDASYKVFHVEIGCGFGLGFDVGI